MIDDFEMLIFSFFGQKSRVNNLAMVGSITWPYFGPKFCTEIWPGYWPYFFHTFFVKFVFFKNLILPAERRGFLKNKKKQQKNNKNRWPSYWLMLARLLTLQHKYIYIYIYIYMLWSYYLGHVWGFLIVTNWATFVFWKGCFSKKHYKNRGSQQIFCSKKRGPKIFNSF